MKKAFLQRFQLLCNDIAMVQREALSLTVCLEKCFGLTIQAISILRAELTDFHFPTEAEEIDFFKNVHTLFLSEVYYFSLLYHAELFKPTDPITGLYFWQREAQREQRFCEEHSFFFAAYFEDCVERDSLFFTRWGNKQYHWQPPVYNDMQDFGITGGSVLLGRYKALQRYRLHMQQNRPNLHEINKKNGIEGNASGGDYF